MFFDTSLLDVYKENILNNYSILGFLAYLFFPRFGFLPNDLIAWIKRREFINKEDIALIKRIHTYENMLRKDTVKLTTLQSYSQFYTKEISIQDPRIFWMIF